jgi:alkylation response protein AidB-like acyl-CoA dehydrogenase
LEGTIAEIASPPKQGIKFIMNLANITRLHNITTSTSYMRRMLALVEDYSSKRIVFGKPLSEQPLHIHAVAEMKAIVEGNVLLVLQLAKMQGKLDNDKDYKNKEFYRFLLPMAKVFAGRCSELVCLEGIQSFGGVGYMENSGIPGILRDTIVTSIWEGSINLLSYDFFKILTSKSSPLSNLSKKIEKYFKGNYMDMKRQLLLKLNNIIELLGTNPKVEDSRNILFR